jgi:8-oxo-dGTP pyrophosphatase MutT (NUDIX family)
MMATRDHSSVRLQYGALPYRFTAAGALKVLLITSRTTRRWIIPKGWPLKSLRPALAAAREAYEEAGVHGTIERKAFSTYAYDKRLDDDGSTVRCNVKVFPLHVKRQLKVWPEQHERQTRWFAASEAATIAGDEGLGSVIADFAAQRLRFRPS